VHAALAGKGLLPRAHLVDGGYTDSNMLVTSPQQYGVEIIGPVAADPSWQARTGTGFRNTAFAIDWAAKRATCPQGHQSRKWHPEQDISGQEVIQIRFAKKTCNTCGVREQCTKAKREPRTVTVRTQTHHEVFHAARQWQRTPAFQEQYALRAGIESTISHGVRRGDLRRSRYIG